ncbi:hypothetical protein Afil01_40770 [Actinorhabdospora filicis]|uniref:Uncharacterized protein n=1 Tax=Actinorhabdospora filicis TaxID=1785913 RepID=A0A9W6SLR2_9ACTN|nr:hypothetical protein [Actinorhabdospora filicis]GLZ79270.1 hypothetical protein Afil01_40770 [Actinorhabdospora filicis]
MIRVLGRAADSVLGRLVPKASASADTSWTEWCGPCQWIDAFGNYARPFKTCHVVGGTSGCTPCNTLRVGC